MKEKLLAPLHLDKLKEKDVLVFFLIFGALFHFLTPIFSEGFHRLDEQTGILRFLSLKLGTMSEDKMIAEYPMKIRPWLQPALYYFFIKPLHLVGLENPFHMAWFLRALSSILGFLSMGSLYMIARNFIQKESSRIVLIYSLFTLWFLPFFHARTTAENFGITFFLFGMSLIFNRRHLVFGGILLGLSFVFRFQMSVMIFFSVLWLPLFGKQSWMTFFKISFGILVGWLLTIPLDFWGYGEWTLTPWNYFNVNILQGFASSFGVDPWYTYITKGFSRGIPPVSLLYIAAFLYCWIKHPKSWLTWTTLPFLIVHSMISHKELRFIFPMALFIPMAFAYVIEHTNTLSKKPLRLLVGLCLVINMGALFVASLKPAYSQIGFYKHVYENKIDRLSYLDSAPRQFPFYLHKDIEYSKANLDALTGNVLTTNFTQREQLLSKKDCKPLYSSYPEWVFKINIGNWKKRSKVWSIWDCSN
jgi:phosphatidylinositol glycan class B